jgi:hypothetical protein
VRSVAIVLITLDQNFAVLDQQRSSGVRATAVEILRKVANKREFDQVKARLFIIAPKKINREY